MTQPHRLRAYDKTQLMDKAAFLDFVIEVVRCLDDEPGFKLVPRRWVVERTFGWLIPAVPTSDS